MYVCMYVCMFVCMYYTKHKIRKHNDQISSVRQKDKSCHNHMYVCMYVCLRMCTCIVYVSTFTLVRLFDLMSTEAFFLYVCTYLFYIHVYIYTYIQVLHPSQCKDTFFPDARQNYKHTRTSAETNTHIHTQTRKYIMCSTHKHTYMS